MPFYMFQGRYTADAIKAMIETPQDREAAARALIESLGGKLHQMYFTLGQDDIIAIIECPDDATMVAGSMAVGGSGAFSGGRTTKLLSTTAAMSAMQQARAVAGGYKSPTS